MKIPMFALAALALLVVAACGDDSDDSSGGATDTDTAEINEQLDVIRQRLDFHDTTIQQAKIIGAMNTFHIEALHEIDEEMQTAAEIQPGWSASTERMLQAAQSVDWPAELQDRAHALEDTLDSLMDSLDGGDLATAKGTVSDAHSQWHDLEHDAYHFVAGPQPDHGHEHDEPAESATPTATGS